MLGDRRRRRGGPAGPRRGASRRSGATCSRPLPGEGRWEHRAARRRQHRHRRRPGRAARPGSRAARARRPGRRRPGRRPGIGLADALGDAPDAHRRPAARSAGRSSASTRSRRSPPRSGFGVLTPHRARRPLVRRPGATMSRARCPTRPTSRPGCGAPAVAARVGLWLGICFGVCFVTGLISHYAQSRVPAGPVPDQPVVGLPGHPGPARHHRHGGGPAAAGEALDGLPASCSTRPPRGRLGQLALDGARAGLDRRPGRGRDLPARDRAWPTRRSGTRGPSPSAPPTTRSPGSRSARSSCTSP